MKTKCCPVCHAPFRMVEGLWERTCGHGYHIAGHKASDTVKPSPLFDAPPEPKAKLRDADLRETAEAYEEEPPADTPATEE